MIRQTLEFLEHELPPQGIASRARNADERVVRRLAREGRWAEAVPVVEKWLAAQPDSPDGNRFLADAHYHAKRYAPAAARYQRVGDMGQQPAVMWYNAACCLALIGEKERALALLEKAFATGFIQDRAAVVRDPDLASLAGEPRFQALVRP